MTREELVRAARLLPPGASITLPVSALLAALGGTAGRPAVIEDRAAPTWRERLWICPAETRLGVRELAEAMNRPPSWVYRAVSPWRWERGDPKDAKATRRKVRRLDPPLPCERLNGELVFHAGRVRQWLDGKKGKHLEERPELLAC